MALFGVPEYGFLGMIMFFIALFVVVEFRPEKQPALRIILVGFSVLMMTLATTGLTVMIFAGFGLYNLFETVRG